MSSNAYTLLRPTALAVGEIDLTARGVHLARLGADRAIELPLTTRYLDEVSQALRVRRPEPVWLQEPIWRPVEGQAEDTRYRWVAQTQRPEYRQAVEQFDRDLTAAVALSAIDLDFHDADGEPVPPLDWAKRREVWRRLGGSETELARIAFTVQCLQGIGAEDRERFLSAPSATTTSPPGTDDPTPTASASPKASSARPGSAKPAGTPAPTSA